MMSHAAQSAQPLRTESLATLNEHDYRFQFAVAYGSSSLALQIASRRHRPPCSDLGGTAVVTIRISSPGLRATAPVVLMFILWYQGIL